MSRWRISDQAGFWMVTFCSFGLLVIAIAEPRISARYDDIESRRVFILSKSESSSGQPVAPDYPKYSLRPIQIALIAGAAIGAVMLGWNGLRQYRRRGGQADKEASSTMGG